MFLYEREDFRDILNLTSTKSGIGIDIVERDYWYAYCSYMLTNYDSKITIKGSYALTKIFDHYFRMPNDLDFSLEIPNDDLSNKRSCVRAAIKSIGQNLELDQEATSNLYGVFSFPAMYCIDNTIRIESLIYSPLGRKRDRLHINTFIYLYLANDEINAKYPELSFDANIYDKRLMAIDKTFCIFYFTSSEFRGDQSRLYGALYDISYILSAIDLEDEYMINLVAMKISEKYKGRFAYRAYSEFFNVEPENWKVNSSREGYVEYLKINGLRAAMSFEQAMNSLGRFRNFLLSDDVLCFLVRLVNEINGLAQ